jgi:Protein of unknown function (DUF664)
MTSAGCPSTWAYVEDDWCSRWLHGRDRQPPWGTVGLEGDPDWNWHSAAEDSPEQLHTLWQDTVSRFLVAETLADGGLDRLTRRTWPNDRAPSLRWILFHDPVKRRGPASLSSARAGVAARTLTSCRHR